MSTFWDSAHPERRRWTRAETAELLISDAALTSISIDDALQIVKHMQGRRATAGTVLVQEGQPQNDYLLMILQGEARLQTDFARKGDYMIFAALGPGDIVGEGEMIGGENRLTTCLATSDIELAVMDRAGLTELIKQHPDVAVNFLGLLFQRQTQRTRAYVKQLRTLTQINRSLVEELDSMKGLRRLDKAVHLQMGAPGGGAPDLTI